MPDSSFVKHDYVAEYLHNHINNYVKKGNYVNFTEPYNSCNITECDRRLLYRAYGIESKEKILGKISKKYLNEKWLSIIEKIPKVKILNRDVLVANNEINLCAEIDFICEVGGKKTVINVYESQYDKIQRKHIVDIMIKMWISGIKHGILIYDRQNDNYIVKHITPYGSIIHAISNKCKQLEANRINGMLIDRPYNNEESEECQQCEYRELCWKGTKWEKGFIQSTPKK